MVFFWAYAAQTRSRSGWTSIQPAVSMPAASCRPKHQNWVATFLRGEVIWQKGSKPHGQRKRGRRLSGADGAEPHCGAQAPRVQGMPCRVGAQPLNVLCGPHRTFGLSFGGGVVSLFPLP